MASPVGHSLFGLGIYSAANNQLNWKEIFVYVVLANLADFDFLFGFVVGEPNKYHHQFTHSIVMAVVIAGIFAFMYCRKNKDKLVKIFVLFFSVYFSHILIDFLTVDKSFPFGEQLLWPFSNHYYLSPVCVFMDVHKSDSSNDFFRSLFSMHNFVMVLSEIGIFGTFFLMVNLIRKKGIFLYKLGNK